MSITNDYYVAIFIPLLDHIIIPLLPVLQTVAASSAIGPSSIFHPFTLISCHYYSCYLSHKPTQCIISPTFQLLIQDKDKFNKSMSLRNIFCSDTCDFFVIIQIASLYPMGQSVLWRHSFYFSLNNLSLLDRDILNFLFHPETILMHKPPWQQKPEGNTWEHPPISKRVNETKGSWKKRKISVSNHYWTVRRIFKWLCIESSLHSANQCALFTTSRCRNWHTWWFADLHNSI